MSDHHPALAALLDTARRAPNRGRTHVFLGDPLSDGCDKTTVEPGNVYSPGVWTCGVSLGFVVGDRIVTPDLLPDDGIRWTFIERPGDPPEAVASYAAGPLTVRHRLIHRGGEGAEGADFNAVESRAAGRRCPSATARPGAAGSTRPAPSPRTCRTTGPRPRSSPGSAMPLLWKKTTTSIPCFTLPFPHARGILSA